MFQKRIKIRFRASKKFKEFYKSMKKIFIACDTTDLKN